jgi:hypothetical protein
VSGMGMEERCHDVSSRNDGSEEWSCCPRQYHKCKMRQHMEVCWNDMFRNGNSAGVTRFRDGNSAGMMESPSESKTSVEVKIGQE